MGGETKSQDSAEVARQPHKLKVRGSNPLPATKRKIKPNW